MKLYYFPGSCALAPHVVLNWLSVEYEAVRVTKGSTELMSVNPLGVVPALEHNGRVHTQADAILHYLADLFPETGLGADDTPESSYELNNWMAFFTGDLHPAFFPFFNAPRYTVAKDEASLSAVKEASLKQIDKFYRHLEGHLVNREFIFADRRTIADAYAIPMLRWGRLIPGKLDPYPELARFLDRWENDAGVRRALDEQGLK